MHYEYGDHHTLHLFSRTQHRFILIHTVSLHVCYKFRHVLGPSSGLDNGLSAGRNM